MEVDEGGKDVIGHQRKVADNGRGKSIRLGYGENIKNVFTSEQLAARQLKLHPAHVGELPEQGFDLQSGEFRRARIGGQIAVNAAFIAAISKFQHKAVEHMVVSHELADFQFGVLLRVGTKCNARFKRRTAGAFTYQI
jgi:hypothetical protein